MCELEGVELDEAVARVLWVEPGAAYSTDWSHGGPLIERFSIHLNGPESRVHRNGGPNSGWGQSGFWTCTSWKLRKADGHRALGYHETSPLIAAMRMVAECSLTANVEVQGRDAASSRRVPWNDGFGVTGNTGNATSLLE